MNESSPFSAESITPTWVICFTLSAIMTLATIWIAVSFILYARSSSILTQKSRSDMDGGHIFKSALASVILPIFKYITTLMIMIVGLNSENHKSCQVIIYISNVCLVAPIVSVYIFLWLRQRAFYSHPSLGTLFNRAISTLSKLSLLLIIPPILTSLIVDMTTNQYTSDERGCIFRNDQDQNKYRFFIYGAILTLGQGTLIGLFVYPLYVHSKSQHEFNSERFESTTTEHGQTKYCVESQVRYHKSADSSQVQTSYQEENRSAHLPGQTSCETIQPSAPGRHSEAGQAHVVSSKDFRPRRKRKTSKVYKLIKRTLLLSSISMLSDLIGMGMSGFMAGKNSPYYIVCILLDVDIIVNTVTIVGSFRNWTEILFGGVVKGFHNWRWSAGSSSW